MGQQLRSGVGGLFGDGLSSVVLQVNEVTKIDDIRPHR